MTDIKLGALAWNQYTDWASLLQAGIRADELGYDTLWTWGLRQSSSFDARGGRCSRGGAGPRASSPR